jgi:hypothetical protein
MVVEKCVVRTQGYAKEGINSRTQKLHNQKRLDICHQTLQREQMKEEGIGRACGMHRGEEKFVQGFEE